jgi:hypothetical protein
MDESGRLRTMIRRSDPYSVHALKVRQVCNGAGVPIIYYGYYLRYGREIWSLVVPRCHSGEALIAGVALRVARWKLLGLNEAVLQAIHHDVFNVSTPLP